MIEIVCSADGPYLPHVSAMLHSLLTHTRRRPLRIWLMHGRDLPIDGMAKLEATVTGLGAQLQYLRMPDALLDGFPTIKFHYSCWYRVLLPEVDPGPERMLYLDCDTIVTDDLAPLWDTDLGGRPFGAIVNPLFPPMYETVRNELGISDFRDYLNSGVLLLDLKRMREEGLAARLREYAKEHPENNCPEQDALSVLMRGRWLSLHPRWNVQATMYDLKPSMLPIPEPVLKEALAKPAVIHFNGPFKPWQYLCKHPRRGLYFEHLKGTPWPLEPLENSSFVYRLIRPLSLSMQYRALWALVPLGRALRRRYRRVMRALGAEA